MTIARKRTIVWRTTSGLTGLVLAWLLGVWPPPVWWRDHWPEQTAMMRLRDSSGAYQPMPIARFPGVLQRMIIIGEDSRFRMHHGVDLDEIHAGFAAVDRRGGVQADQALDLAVRERVGDGRPRRERDRGPCARRS